MIKMDYECPECEESFGGEEWNVATEEEFGAPIVRIEDEDAEESAFVCPNCRALVEYHEFGEETENEATELN